MKLHLPSSGSPNCHMATWWIPWHMACWIWDLPRQVSGCLTFTKIKARNLRSADLMDESDPFVKFELGTLTRPQITSTVWNNEKCRGTKRTTLFLRLELVESGSSFVWGY